MTNVHSNSYCSLLLWDGSTKSSLIHEKEMDVILKETIDYTLEILSENRHNTLPPYIDPGLFIQNMTNQDDKNDTSVLYTHPLAYVLPAMDPLLPMTEIESSSDKSSAEEEKRKRNTAASARFRIKKKMRVEEMELDVRDLTQKTQSLGQRIKDLDDEIKKLKSILINKA